MCFSSLENGAHKKKLRAKVTYSYAPQNEDELPLEVDSEVEVTSQPEPGWWEGVVNGKKGMFPSNFVELLPEEEEKPESGRFIVSLNNGNTECHCCYSLVRLIACLC